IRWGREEGDPGRVESDAKRVAPEWSNDIDVEIDAIDPLEHGAPVDRLDTRQSTLGRYLARTQHRTDGGKERALDPRCRARAREPRLVAALLVGDLGADVAGAVISVRGEAYEPIGTHRLRGELVFDEEL